AEAQLRALAGMPGLSEVEKAIQLDAVETEIQRLNQELAETQEELEHLGRDQVALKASMTPTVIDPGPTTPGGLTSPTTGFGGSPPVSPMDDSFDKLQNFWQGVQNNA